MWNKIKFDILAAVPVKIVERVFLLFLNVLRNKLAEINLLPTCMNVNPKRNCIHIRYVWIYFTARSSITKDFTLVSQEKSVSKKKKKE